MPSSPQRYALLRAMSWVRKSHASPIRTVVLAHRAPRTFAQIRPPLAPQERFSVCFRKALSFGGMWCDYGLFLLSASIESSWNRRSGLSVSQSNNNRNFHFGFRRRHRLVSVRSRRSSMLRVPAGDMSDEHGSGTVAQQASVVRVPHDTHIVGIGVQAHRQTTARGASRPFRGSTPEFLTGGVVQPPRGWPIPT